MPATTVRRDQRGLKDRSEKAKELGIFLVFLWQEIWRNVVDCLGRMFLRLIRSWCSAISSKITWHVDQIHWLRTISIPMERKSKFHWITSSKVAMNPSTMEKRNCFWKSRSVVTCINSKTPHPTKYVAW